VPLWRNHITSADNNAFPLYRYCARSYQQYNTVGCRKERQQWVPFARLSSCRIYCSAVNNTNALRCSCKVSDIVVRYCCPNLTTFGVPRQIFVNVLSTKFQENPLSRNRAETCRQAGGGTDRRRDRQAVGQTGGWTDRRRQTDRRRDRKMWSSQYGLFAIYANAPKIKCTKLISQEPNVFKHGKCIQCIPLWQHYLRAVTDRQTEIQNYRRPWTHTLTHQTRVQAFKKKKILGSIQILEAGRVARSKSRAGAHSDLWTSQSPGAFSAVRNKYWGRREATCSNYVEKHEALLSIRLFLRTGRRTGFVHRCARPDILLQIYNKNPAGQITSWHI
jgi:hypothetical protein